jgi:hypothetical protein
MDIRFGLKEVSTGSRCQTIAVLARRIAPDDAAEAFAWERSFSVGLPGDAILQPGAAADWGPERRRARVPRKRDRPGWSLAVPGTSARKWRAKAASEERRALWPEARACFVSNIAGTTPEVLAGQKPAGIGQLQSDGWALKASIENVGLRAW